MFLIVYIGPILIDMTTTSTINDFFPTFLSVTFFLEHSLGEFGKKVSENVFKVEVHAAVACMALKRFDRIRYKVFLFWMFVS